MWRCIVEAPRIQDDDTTTTPSPSSITITITTITITITLKQPISFASLLAMSALIATVSAFIQDAPPGEVITSHRQPSPSIPTTSNNHPNCPACRRRRRYASATDTIAPSNIARPNLSPPWSAAADIKNLTLSEPGIVAALTPAFEKYNEEQLTTTKLPGGSQSVIVSSYAALGDGRYYDVASSSSFDFDHVTQVNSEQQMDPTTIDAHTR